MKFSINVRNRPNLGIAEPPFALQTALNAEPAEYRGTPFHFEDVCGSGCLLGGAVDAWRHGARTLRHKVKGIFKSEFITFEKESNDC